MRKPQRKRSKRASIRGRGCFTQAICSTRCRGLPLLVGRKDDIIKTRGEKVSPKEVENVLYDHPGISEAVVLATPDTVLGSAIKAIVVASPGVELSDKDVLRHCSRHLEDFMVPKHVEFRDSLPKTDSGKISRRLLEEAQQAAEMTMTLLQTKDMTTADGVSEEYSPAALELDTAAETARIRDAVREQVMRTLRRRGRCGRPVRRVSIAV